MKLHDRMEFYVPDEYDERVHTALYAPSSASGPTINVVRKTIDVTTWIVGNNAMLTVQGGTVKVLSLSVRVSVAFTSGGAPTLTITYPGGGGSAVIALGTLGAVDRVLGTQSAANANFFVGSQGAREIGAMTAGATLIPSPAIISSVAAATALLAQVAAATYTAGALDVYAEWVAITPGATLT